MVNPYAVNQAQRAPAKTRVSLGSSNALKKFEKFQSKYNPNMTSIERKKEKKKNKPAKGILDTTDEDDESDDDDDSMIIRNANKFMKKKAPEAEAALDSSDDSDIEISAMDGSSTPNKPASKQRAKSPAHPIINRSNNSSATSMRSMTHTHKRSQSKVKFMNDYSEDESTIIDDMLSKNLIMDIEDLEAHTASMSVKASKPGKDRRGKSPSHHKRSESVISIQEESILEESLYEEEAASEAPSLTNLIMDIQDLEASISKLEKKEKKIKKHERKRQDSESLTQRDRKSDKNSKSKRKVSTSITTAFDKSDSSILTESVPDIDEDDDIKTVKSDIDEISTRSVRTRSTTKEASRSNRDASYFDDFETEKTTRHSTTLGKKDKKESKKEKKQSALTPRTPRTVSYGFDDIETTDFDVDAMTPRREKKQLSFFEAKVKPVATSNAEIQCDPTDLLRNHSLLNTVNVYNPSSILLATASHLNSENTLKDLNQITGYQMINQTFNDILKVNINFVKNFLSAQRSMYEQQISTIQPKPREY